MIDSTQLNSTQLNSAQQYRSLDRSSYRPFANVRGRNVKRFEQMIRRKDASFDDNSEKSVFFLRCV